jgi:hypothetical protein
MACIRSIQASANALLGLSNNPVNLITQEVANSPKGTDDFFCHSGELGLLVENNSTATLDNMLSAMLSVKRPAIEWNPRREDNSLKNCPPEMTPRITLIMRSTPQDSSFHLAALAALR